MPYSPFLEAARQQRYDIDVLGRRFRVGFEQICHRLTTMRRAGDEGVPFHMVRIDVGGNISKRFSASGIRIARYSGACPKWNIFAAFQTPGMIRIQVSRTPEGQVYFCIARTIQKDSGGYHAQQPVMVVGLGCSIEYAREMIYSDGIALDNPDICVPVGTPAAPASATTASNAPCPQLRAHSWSTRTSAAHRCTRPHAATEAVRCEVLRLQPTNEMQPHLAAAMPWSWWAPHSKLSSLVTSDQG